MVHALGRLWFASLVLSVSGCRSLPEGSFRRCAEVDEPVQVGCVRDEWGSWTCDGCWQNSECFFTVEARYFDRACCAPIVQTFQPCHCEWGRYECNGTVGGEPAHPSETTWCVTPCDAGVDASIPDAWSRDVGQDASGDARAMPSDEDAGMDAGDALVCDDASC